MPDKQRRQRRHSLLVPQALAAHNSWKHELFKSHLSPGQEELSLSDLKVVMHKLHIPDSRVEQIFALVDTDGNGYISYQEFSKYVDRHET